MEFILKSFVWLYYSNGKSIFLFRITFCFLFLLELVYIYFSLFPSFLLTYVLS